MISITLTMNSDVSFNFLKFCLVFTLILASISKHKTQLKKAITFAEIYLVKIKQFYSYKFPYFNIKGKNGCELVLYPIKQQNSALKNRIPSSVRNSVYQ